MGVHSGYNSFLLKQKENSGSVTATFRDMFFVKDFLSKLTKAAFQSICEVVREKLSW